MILKKNKLLYCALFLCLPSILSANFSTLQYWDPIPYHNAANFNMAPNTPFMYAIKQRLVSDDAERQKHFGLNFSPFVQKATKAQQIDDFYFGDVSITQGSLTPQFAYMSCFQGTPSLMGLFIGQDKNGNSIWGNSTAEDTSIITQITETTINATLLPDNVKDALFILNDVPTATNNISSDYASALIMNPATNDVGTAPSIFSQMVLEQDPIFFGAFGVPLVYQKAGLRWEANFDFCDYVGIVARGGFCQITQRTLAPVSISDTSSIYSNLQESEYGTSGTETSTTATAQGIFNQYISNNIYDLLDATYGADYDISTFNEVGIEDIQVMGFLRYPIVMHPSNPDKYGSMIITPYTIIGYSIPIEGSRNYSQLYSLPLGNNGHAAINGVAGVTFDFIEGIEFGFEVGGTGFLEQTIEDVPCPNHRLQRVIYPYRRDLKITPGFNSQFSLIFNAFNFTENINFSFRYDYIDHSEDDIKQVESNKYFFTDHLERLSAWKSQNFITGLTFNLQENIALSVAWQGAFSQKNAYCSNTILGSLNCQF
jgi:hypothetical protein